MGRRLVLFFSAVVIAMGVVVMPRQAQAQTSNVRRFARVAGSLEGPPSSVGVRPLLVIVMHLPDSANDFVGPWDHGFTVNRFFGAGGVSEYLQAASGGSFSFVPAAGDGVVDIDYPGNADDLSTAQRAGIAGLRAADPSVDFAAFDRDGNGRIDGRELAVEVVTLGGSRVGPGETRAISGYDSSFTELDGVGFGGDFMVATVNGYSNFMTDVHELFHQSFDTFDGYYWGVGRLDIMGPTYGVADSARWMPSAVTRLQLGWSSPDLVEQDGTYNVGDGVIIHDPTASDARFFMVEAHGANAVVWRVSNDLPRRAANDFVRAVEPITPQVVSSDQRVIGCQSGGCRGGDESDAFSSPVTFGLHYTSTGATYSSGAYSGIAITLRGSSVTVRFGVAEPAPVSTPQPPTVATRRALSVVASPSSTTSTTSTPIVTAATGLWPTVFSTEELGHLVDEMCALELPSCAVYRIESLVMYS